MTEKNRLPLTSYDKLTLIFQSFGNEHQPLVKSTEIAQQLHKVTVASKMPQ
jgi:hypothetical protein